ncbi:MAG: O-methyltransferase [Rhodospirillaceae bacterium]
MSDALWSDVDAMFADALAPEDKDLQATRAATATAGMPDIAVSTLSGKFLAIMAQLQGAKSILEVGTLGGYSTLWMARALPADGRLITLEYDPNHAAVAQANLDRAGVADKVEIKVGAALDTLPGLADNPALPFDLVFIDADKVNNPVYYKWAVSYTRPGSLIIIDNVVRRGAVLDAGSEDPNIQGIRTLTEQVAGDSRVEATVLQTVGSKGYDGIMMIRVKG